MNNKLLWLLVLAGGVALWVAMSDDDEPDTETDAQQGIVAGDRQDAIEAALRASQEQIASHRARNKGRFGTLGGPGCGEYPLGSAGPHVPFGTPGYRPCTGFVHITPIHPILIAPGPVLT